VTRRGRERDEEKGMEWDKEKKCLLYKRKPVINVEGMIQVENHHFVTPM